LARVVSSGIIDNLITIKSLEEERLLNQGCSRKEKMSRIGIGSNFQEG